MKTQAIRNCERITPDLLQNINPRRILFSAGERVFSWHDRADSVFLISQGSVKISIFGIIVSVLSGGDFFGEHCLGPHEYRENSATALEDTELVRIEREDMLEAFRAMPALREVFVANLIRQQQGLGFLLGLKLCRDSTGIWEETERV